VAAEPTVTLLTLLRSWPPPRGGRLVRAV